MSELALVYVTVPDAACADSIAQTLVRERLAACVTALAPARSTFAWAGEIETASEIPLLIKVPAAQAAAARARIAALHPYDLPVIEQWPVQVDAAVLAWADAAVGR